jgi:Uma2 family endonuclease
VVAQTKEPYITREQYIKREIDSDNKSEYVDGVVVAMAGASPTHIQITKNVTVELEPYIRRARCKSYPTEMRVRIDSANRYYYPDYVVVCGRPDFDAMLGLEALVNPTLIVEVLSESTERRDRSEKLFAYKRMTTLEDYLLIHQDEPLIEHYKRNSNTGAWEFDTIEGLDSILNLPLLNCSLALSVLYVDVEFTTPQTPYAAL